MDDIQNPGSSPQAPVTSPPSTTEVSEGTSAPEPTPAPQEAPASVPHTSERRGMAALSYVGLFCLVPLLFAKDSAFAQYHAKQGVVLVVVGVILHLVRGVPWEIPFGGVLRFVLGLAVVVVSIMGIVKALRGEKFEIPYISEWATKLHF